MKFIDILNILKGECQITLYESGLHDPLCFTRNTWHGVDPYHQREVLSIEFTTEPRSRQGEIEIVLAISAPRKMTEEQKEKCAERLAQYRK